MAAPFMLDLYGLFSREHVRVEWRHNAASVHPEIERLKAAWPRHVEETTARGGVLFNGQMVRCLGHRLTDGRLVIEAGPTDYATFFCTNYLNSTLGDQIGWEHFANPIGISANVLTPDGWALYGRRNQKVACHAGWVHTFGGTVDEDDRDDAGNVDVFASMIREVREELSVSDNEVAEIVCLGMIRDPAIRNPELIFDVRLRCDLGELRARILPDDPEHASIAACPDRADACLDFIRQAQPIAPVAVGSLCLHARRRFGDDVYASLVEGLGRE